MKEKKEVQQEKEELWARALLIILLLIGISLISLGAAFNEFSTFWGMVLRDIGFVFAPIAILALFYERFAQKEHTRYIAKEVGREVLIEIEKRVGHFYGHKDIIAIYPNRNSIDLNKYFSMAEKNIDILVTNLISLEMHIGLLIKLANEGVNVRILALNPKHEFLKNRSKELQFRSSRQFYTEMVASLRTFCAYKKDKVSDDKKSNFSIRIYDNSPSHMLFQRDNRVIIGFILQQGKSRELIHIDFDCIESKPCKDFMEDFRLIWETSNDVDIDKISELEKNIEKEVF